MSDATTQIQDNMVVELAYVLTVDNEQTTGSEEKPASVQFVQGQSQVVPGLEQELYGMTVGDEKDIVVEAAKGYGETNPNSVKTLSREKLRSFDQAQAGQRVRLLHKKSGEVHTATILEIKPDVVVLDFNHPLAGKKLHFHVRVDGLRPATTEELEAPQTKSNGAVEQVKE